METPFWARTEFMLGIALAALLGSFAMIAFIRITLGAICAALLLRAILEWNPQLFATVPSREWALPGLIGGLIWVVGALVYLIWFTPQPAIQLSVFRFSLLPYADNRQLVTGQAAFVNDGDAAARNIQEAKSAYRRPDGECADHVLTEPEIQQFANEVHAIFMSQIANNTELVAELLPVHGAFAQFNSGEALDDAKIKQLQEGKCVYFFVTRIIYAGNHFTDYFRFVHNTRIGKIERFEQRQ